MTIPPDFNDIESLTDIVKREHNRLVRLWFANVPDDDVITPKSRLKRACLIKDDDPLLVALQRQWLFEVRLGKTRSLQRPVYGVPARVFQESFAGKPQVFLFFSQDKESVPDGLDPVSAEISFRLHDETSSSITETKAKSIANGIKRELISGNKGIYFSKGKNIYSYVDKSQGYQLQIYSTSQTEAEKVIIPVLKIRNHLYDVNKLRESISKRPSLNIPRKWNTVYGKQKKERRWRPTARVRFRSAYLYVHGLDYNIPLIDTTGNWIDALVRV